jgi:hypothetical protein
MARNKPLTGPKHRKTPPQQEQPNTTEDDGKWETMDTEPQKLKQEGNMAKVRNFVNLLYKFNSGLIIKL